MNTIETLLSLVNPRDHKKALIAIHPMVMPEVRYDVALRIAQFDAEEQSIEATIDHICECVTMFTGVKNIRETTSRKRPEVMARQMVIFCACAELVGTKKLTLLQVGSYFANKYNHALIIHCRTNIADLYITDNDIRETMDKVAECLYLNGLIYTKVCLNSTI